MGTTKNNKFYLLIIGILSISSYLLNQYSEIYKCAAIYTTIFGIIRISHITYGQKKSIYALAIALTTSMIFLGKLTYFIDHKAINSLVIVSFSSVALSILCSSIVFEKLRNRHHLDSVKINLISLLVAAVTDGLVMGAFFILDNNLKHAKIMNILIKETLFKMAYGCTAYILIRIVLEISKKRGGVLLRQQRV